MQAQPHAKQRMLYDLDKAQQHLGLQTEAIPVQCWMVASNVRTSQNIHRGTLGQPNKSQRMLGSKSTPTPTFARWTRNVDATFGFSMLNLAAGRDANLRLPLCKWLCLVDVLRVKVCGRAPCEDLWKCARDNSLQCVGAITVIDVARGSGQCLASSAYTVRLLSDA